jgi:hypothetical protein
MQEIIDYKKDEEFTNKSIGHIIFTYSQVIFLLFILQTILDNSNRILLFFRKLKGDNKDKDEKVGEKETIVVPLLKYEEKYLTEYKLLNEELDFTEDELELEKTKTNEILKNLEMKLADEIEQLVKERDGIIEDLKELESLVISEDYKAELKIQKGKHLDMVLGSITSLSKKTIDNEEVVTLAREHITNEKLDRLKNSIIIEKTPLGNVILFYNNSRDSFEYYSDNTIPYRYLEVVARKYVVTFKCKQIYIDMEKEIELAEKKLKEKKESNTVSNKPSTKKPPVFAKFKSYNKDTSKTSASAAKPGPKTVKTNEDCVLKERANRYSYEGKIANYNFLKKVDRKVIDKRYALSFADFKKMSISPVKNNIY